MMPAILQNDRLYVFVVGPGFGESIIVRVPPAHWLVVDSCKPGERAAALEFLTRFDGVCACAVLTHRHRDHYPGFSQVLAHDDWDVIGCADLRLPADSVQAQNPEVHRRNELEDIMAAIQTRWSASKEARWRTWRHSQQTVGDAVLTSLHPAEAFAQQNPDADPNVLSSALLLRWKEVRILLGADVENPHWEEIAREFPGLRDHAAMKVPHHASHASAGSEGALHTSFLEGSNSRFWVVTPYSKGRRLPRMEDGQGIHQLLNHVSCLYLTGLPVRHDRQADAPCETTRAECQQEIRPRPLAVPFAGGITGRALDASDAFKCWIGAEFSDEGTCENVWYGPGSIRMTG